MKRAIGLTVLVFIGIAAWRIVDGLSSDAISMGIGVLCGVLAGLPMALLVLASARRSSERTTTAAEYGMNYSRYAQQPPVIVVTGTGQGPLGQGWSGAAYPAALPPDDGWDGPRADRNYRIIGEQEDWDNE